MGILEEMEEGETVRKGEEDRRRQERKGRVEGERDVRREG